MAFMGLREAPEHLRSARIYGASQRITFFPRMIQANSFFTPKAINYCAMILDVCMLPSTVALYVKISCS